MEKIIRPPLSKVEWTAYYDLRYRILRAPWNQPPGSEKNDGDQAAEHAACFLNGEIIGVGRLDLFENEYGQIRFMAVENNYQGCGIGKSIIQYLEDLSLARGDKGMVLHARENALEFYNKLGYSLVEKSHLLFGEIQHYLMSKDYDRRK